MIKPKGLKEILEENPSLARKVTYEEFEDGACTPRDEEEPLERAYESYRQAMCGM